MTDDLELLRLYAKERSETAFAELTQRHVDLVFSAALRLMNGDVHAAQDVTQQVFTEVARQAGRLAMHPTLVGWLYTTTRHVALHAQRTDQRRKAREQEANSMNELLNDDAAPADWNQIRPVIESAMHELDDKDRHAVLLRFFQNKSLKEVGAALDLTENAARMRVDRALDKLRGQLARRGVTTTAAALAAVVAANAVHAAPSGFVAGLSAAAIAGSAVPASIIITATKAIAMTTFQKTVIAASLVAAVGTGIYAVHQNSEFHQKMQTLQQERAPLTAQLQQLEQERDHATEQVAALREENTRLKSGSNSSEVVKLRGETGNLRRELADTQAKVPGPTTGMAKLMSDPAMQQVVLRYQRERIRSMYSDLIKELNLTQDQTDKFLDVINQSAQKHMSLMTTASQDPTAQAAAQSEAAQADQQAGADLKALLGDAGVARFADYSQEIPGRMTISLLNNQLADDPLNKDQTAQLIQVIKSEPYTVTQGMTGAPDRAFLGSQTDVDNFLQQVDQSNQRILQQAGGFLSADQLAALNGVLTKGIQSRKDQAAAFIQKH